MRFRKLPLLRHLVRVMVHPVPLDLSHRVPLGQIQLEVLVNLLLLQQQPSLPLQINRQLSLDQKLPSQRHLVLEKVHLDQNQLDHLHLEVMVHHRVLMEDRPRLEVTAPRLVLLAGHLLHLLEVKAPRLDLLAGHPLHLLEVPLLLQALLPLKQPLLLYFLLELLLQFVVLVVVLVVGELLAV